MVSCTKNTEDDTDESNGITFEGYRADLLSFINENEGWILVNDNNDHKYKLVHSTDGFENYTVINDDMPKLISFEFLDANVGFERKYGGTNANYYTNDGGVTWQNFGLPSNPYNDGCQMMYNGDYFTIPLAKEDANDSKMRVVVRYYNRSDFSYSHETLFDTEPADTYKGASGSDYHLSSVHVTSGELISFTGIKSQPEDDKSYAAYSDNNTNLHLVALSTDGFRAPEKTVYPTDLVGYYTQKNDAKLYKTTDGGVSWSSVYSFTSDENKYKKLAFANENYGAVLAGSSKLYLTEDGGQNFAPYNLELGDYIDGVIYEVDYVNENTLYALIGFTDNDAIHTIKLIKIK